jgi:flagellar biogenesis protein FliO
MDWARELSAVVLVLGILAGGLWLLRRRGFAGLAAARGSKTRRLERIERLPLGPHHSLELIRLGEHALVVAAHPAGCSLIGQFDWRELETASERPR